MAQPCRGERVGLIVYIDETGDHNLAALDAGFPAFVLTMLICDTETYNGVIVPEFYKLKFELFGHEGVVFHSRDIRKGQKDFTFLADPVKRTAFYEKMNSIMGGPAYQLIITVIRKTRLKTQYGEWAHNPYNLALKFSLERLLPLLEVAGQTEVQLVAENRGKSQDQQLRTVFERIVTYGTDYIEARRFSAIKFKLDFQPKSKNLIGTQMADLAGYPTGRYALDSTKPNPAFEVIRGKFYRGHGWIHGLKIFP